MLHDLYQKEASLFHIFSNMLIFSIVDSVEEDMKGKVWDRAQWSNRSSAIISRFPYPEATRSISTLPAAESYFVLGLGPSI